MTTSSLSHKLFRTTISKGLAPRQFRFIISSETLDRDKDIIRLSSWDLRTYQKNPVVLASHDHQRLPVGKSVDIGVRGNTLQATVEFPPKGIYDVADTVHDLVELGYLKGASVGFRAHDSEPNGYGGMTIKQAELLEWSICPIGSNPDAVVQRAAPAVMQKWLTGGTWPQEKEDDMYLAFDDAKYLEIDDGLETKEDDDFQAMCDRMLAAYEELTSAKFRELMARQLALLGPNATIDQLVRALQVAGIYAPKRWRGDNDLVEFDDRDFAVAIAQVVGEAAGRQTRAALNQALGRLD